MSETAPLNEEVFIDDPEQLSDEEVNRALRAGILSEDAKMSSESNFELTTFKQAYAATIARKRNAVRVAWPRHE